MQMRIAILGLALLAGLNRPAAALVVDGRLTSALYNYEALKDSATTTSGLEIVDIRRSHRHRGGWWCRR